MDTERETQREREREFKKKMKGAFVANNVLIASGRIGTISVRECVRTPTQAYVCIYAHTLYAYIHPMDTLSNQYVSAH